MAILEVEFSFDEESLDAAFAELERELEDTVRGLTVDVFSNILLRTPQSEGRMVASWTYSIGAPEFVDRSDSVPALEPIDYDFSGTPIYRRLSRGAVGPINFALAANTGADVAFKLGDDVFFANGVDHGEGPYSQAVEDGTIDPPLRRVNQPGHPAKLSIDLAHSRFSENMSPGAAQSLRSKKLA